MTSDQPAAEQLARKIVAEVAWYNSERIDGAANLRLALMDDLLEGREVFRSRVVPALYPVFDAAVATWLAEHGQPIDPGNEVLPALVPARHEPVREEPGEEPREEFNARPFDESYLLPRARRVASDRAERNSRPLMIAVCAAFALFAALVVAWELRSY